jgi:hypothetical protein
MDPPSSSTNLSPPGILGSGVEITLEDTAQQANTTNDATTTARPTFKTPVPSDIQVSQDIVAEVGLLPIEDLAAEAGLLPDEVIPW